MPTEVYRYMFDTSIGVEQIEASLVSAILSAEALHGESRVRLDARHLLSKTQRVCVIDARTEVGRDLNQIFVGLLIRQFDDDSFRVDRLNGHEMPTALRRSAHEAN